MSSPDTAPPAAARLRSLRLVGFKSFAEPTVVEFGAGISAIVGPNGSGKSNLADALRWALGEQGRSLRTRRAEDVIFAGSQRRRATGMADVSLVLDNADGLVPLDYAEVAVGRRLFRSGENEYLVNRQRVRYRDLVELMEGAGLADNAFLFIGQGMVDQALALRPEERRPLFEEVAGVRPHERRRRLAEAQLAEAEANLVRVRDLLGELRPQARRLAAQVEQEAARRAAATDLATAIVAVAHARWSVVQAARRDGTAALQAARADARRALADVRTAEDAIETVANRLSEREPREEALRARLDAARARLGDLRRSQAHADGTLEALEREELRLSTERASVEVDRDEARRALALPPPDEDPAAALALAAVERDLAEARAEVARLRAAVHVVDEQAAALRRAESARIAELDTARRQVAAARQRRDEHAAGLEAATSRLEQERERRHAAAERLASALSGEREAEAGLAAGREAVAEAEGLHAARSSRATAATARLEETRSRLAALEAEVEAEAGRGILAAARRRGGRRVADGLDVDPSLGAAVEVSLGAALRSAAVPSARVGDLATERGVLVLADVSGPVTAEREARRARDAAEAAGGGRLADAVRRDPSGVVRRLLDRAVWVPTLEAALAVRGALPPGWSVATPSGDLVTPDGILTLAGSTAVLERQVARDAIARELAQRAATAEQVAAELATSEAKLAAARSALAAAREGAEAARRERRAAEEADRVAARSAEVAERTASWDAAQLERLETELASAERTLATLESRPPNATTPPGSPEALRVAGAEPGSGRPADRDALAAWEDRVAAGSIRREELLAASREADRRRRASQDERSRAEARVAVADVRLGVIQAELARLAEERARIGDGRTSARAESGRAEEEERELRSALEALLGEGSSDRLRLRDAERELGAARVRLREADERVRAGELADMEARLAAEALREQLLVELAALGHAGVEALGRAAGRGAAPAAALPAGPGSGEVTPGDDALDAGPGSAAEEDPSAGLEAAMLAAERAWDGGPPPQDAPGPGRLGVLRRRFHELGAPNPYAAAEHVEVSQRLEALERQRDDLERAIRTTRELVAELGALIVEQFRATFAALEDAFPRRFTQLFGGGVARLSLTDPQDLEATGIDITAQPPEKKRQPLAMLSGGERALTAVALLFAMLEVRPVPFCVLDEVDAALDEANIGRFAATLREFAARTQCIVITHNRGTIEAADALYGITIGDDAVSRVISLRLEDVDDAMRRRGDRAPAGQHATTVGR